MKELAASLHPFERRVIRHLKDGITLTEIAKAASLKEVQAMRALQWLSNKNVISIDSQEEISYDLTDLGKRYKNEKLPERVLYDALDQPKTLQELEKNTKLNRQELSAAMGKLKKLDIILLKKEDKGLTLSRSKKAKTLPMELLLDNIDKADAALLKESIKRNLVEKKVSVTKIVKTKKLLKELQKSDLEEDVVDTLTPQMLKKETWKNKTFRSYDVEINVPAIHGGKRHFTKQVVEYIKSIWLNLGFEEMSGPMVQSSFWDLDALFVPQDHPAREMQDTFYLKDPKESKIKKKKIFERVKKTHENGWTTGSKGWKTAWSEKKAKENLLRTHTTVLSAQTIAGLKKDDLPAKFFAVGKCFRNETLDWKHLFEFYQVEGIVIDPDANFSNLVGYLKTFFAQMGFPDCRIRPAHFPYTEPSAEVDVWHPVKKEWVELGGSGIFRPEVTKPLLGFEVPILAWGLGLGRMMSEYWGITDIRELYKNDLKQLRELKVWVR